MPASYTIRRSVPRNTRRSKPASTPSTCFPSFSINLFMAFPLPRGDLSSNTTNIIREQETPSPFGCGYAALWDYDWKIPGPGKYSLAVRAKDDKGRVQPADRAAERLDPYESNAWQRVSVTVT